MNEKNLRAAFKLLDVNSDDAIETSEIKECFTRGNESFKAHNVDVPDDFFEKIVESLDENKDGKVTFEEFQAHMMKMVDEHANKYCT